MDLRFLDQASDMTPLLVRLYDSHKLYSLAKDKNPLARAELSSAVTELFRLNLSSRESELVADVLIELIRQAEKDLKEALSERLSILDNVPLRLVLQISNDEIDVARPMLKNSSVLGDMDLIYIIKSKTPEYWPAIASRKTLNEQVINILADTNDEDTAIALAENEDIALTRHAVEILSETAKSSDRLAQPLLRRSEITKDIADAIFEYVGEELKLYIKETYMTKNAEQQQALSETVEEIITEFKEENKTDGFGPTSSMMSAAARYRDKGILNLSLMLSTLRRGQIRAFIAQFATFTGFDVDLVTRLLEQRSGQGLAIVCKGHEISKSDFVSIYLLTNRMRVGASIMVDLSDMNQAVVYYERVTPELARQIIETSISDLTSDDD